MVKLSGFINFNIGSVGTGNRNFSYFNICRGFYIQENGKQFQQILKSS